MGKRIEFSEVTLRLDVSYRGGVIEIDLSRFGFKGERMMAYQNYLGGGMLGRVLAKDTIRFYGNKSCTEKQVEKLEKIAERLKKYFHTLSNHVDDEWESQSYMQNQNMPVSAY
jgi:hypothetical protein